MPTYTPGTFTALAIKNLSNVTVDSNPLSDLPPESEAYDIRNLPELVTVIRAAGSFLAAATPLIGAQEASDVLEGMTGAIAEAVRVDAVLDAEPEADPVGA